MIFFLFVSGCSSPKNNHPSHTNSAASDSLTKNYSNNKYNISLKKPGKDTWILLEEPNLKAGDFAINLFKRGTGAEQQTPLGTHAKSKHSYVAIWPHGLGTELPKSEYASLGETQNVPDFQFAINEEKSKALLLKNDSVWAYFIVPKNPPENWTENGFIFAQISTENESSTCFDKKTGKKIPLDQCNFLDGDRYVRRGNLNKKDAQTIKNILSSISLQKMKEKASASDLIKIEKPLPNNDVTSPLTVKGKAKGSWYFEGSFHLELVDAYDNMLAEKQVKANGNWMTDDFVPFSVILKFDAPDDQRGHLIFHRANPSGKPENEMHYSLPVIFPPK